MGSVAIIDRGRGPELAGTRITVFDILHYHDAGWHVNSIALILGLSSAQVNAALEYVAEHEEQVRAEQRRIQDRIDRGNSPEILAKFEKSHQKLQALLDRKKNSAEKNGDARDPC